MQITIPTHNVRSIRISMKSLEHRRGSRRTSPALTRINSGAERPDRPRRSPLKCATSQAMPCPCPCSTGRNGPSQAPIFLDKSWKNVYHTDEVLLSMINRTLNTFYFIGCERSFSTVSSIQYTLDSPLKTASAYFNTVTVGCSQIMKHPSFTRTCITKIHHGLGDLLFSFICGCSYTKYCFVSLPQNFTSFTSHSLYLHPFLQIEFHSFYSVFPLRFPPNF